MSSITVLQASRWEELSVGYMKKCNQKPEKVRRCKSNKCLHEFLSYLADDLGVEFVAY